MVETLNTPAEIWDSISDLKIQIEDIIDLHQQPGFEKRNTGEAVRRKVHNFLTSLDRQLPQELPIDPPSRFVLNIQDLYVEEVTPKGKTKLPSSVWEFNYPQLIRVIERGLVIPQTFQAA